MGILLSSQKYRVGDLRETMVQESAKRGGLGQEKMKITNRWIQETRFVILF